MVTGYIPASYARLMDGVYIMEMNAAAMGQFPMATVSNTTPILFMNRASDENEEQIEDVTKTYL